MKAQSKTDEFAFILLGVIVFVAILTISWTTNSSNVYYVSPKSLTFVLSPGESEIRYLAINGSGYVEIKKEGDISNWIEPEYESFTVSGGGKLRIRVSIPSSASYGIYKGKLLIVSNQTTQTVDITIKITNVTSLSSRTITIPDFSISYAGKKKVLLQGKDIKLQNSKRSFVFSISKNEITQLSSLKIKLVIDDTNMKGNIILYLNGVPIYFEKPSEGEVDIPVNTSLLKETNVLIIEMKSPGWRFWEKGYCHIYSFELYAEYNTVSKVINFNLSNDEISNFASLEFISLLKPSVPEPTLKIKLNNQLVYWGKPPLSSIDINITKDLLDNDLVLKRANSLKFYLTDKGSISFSNVLIKILTKK